MKFLKSIFQQGCCLDRLCINQSITFSLYLNKSVKSIADLPKRMQIYFFMASRNKETVFMDHSSLKKDAY